MGGGGAGAEEELTAQETALYDRQIRVWGVDAQKRCASPQPLFLFSTSFHRTSVFLLGWFDSKVPCLVFLAILKQRFSTFCRLFFFSFMTMNFP
jgi:hypothetical protein